MAYIYIVSCEDGSLYTGIAKDIKKRMLQHVNRKKPSAKYTKSHIIKRLEALWETENYADAAKLEYRIKRLTRAKKQEFIANPGKIKEAFSCLSGIDFVVSNIYACPCDINVIVTAQEERDIS